MRSDTDHEAETGVFLYADIGEMAEQPDGVSRVPGYASSHERAVSHLTPGVLRDRLDSALHRDSLLWQSSDEPARYLTPTATRADR